MKMVSKQLRVWCVALLLITYCVGDRASASKSGGESRIVERGEENEFVYTPRHGHLSFADGCGGTAALNVMWNTLEKPPIQPSSQVRVSKFSEGRNDKRNDSDRNDFNKEWSADWQIQEFTHVFNASHVPTTYTPLDFCASPARDSQSSGIGYHHSVLIDDCSFLSPGELYVYSFGSELGWSETRRFRAPIPPPSASESSTALKSSPFSFITYMDMDVSLDAPKSITTARRVLDEVVQAEKEDQKLKVSFVLHNGDLSYAQGNMGKWDDFMSLIEPYASMIPYMVGIGNHEYDYECKCNGNASRRKESSGRWSWLSTSTKSGRDDDWCTKNDQSDPKERSGYHPLLAYYLNDSGGECGVPYYHKFIMPRGGGYENEKNNDNGFNTDSADPMPPFYYSFSYASAHFVVLSSEHSLEPGSKQLTWLLNHLNNNKNKNGSGFDRRRTPWLFFSLHRPLRSSMFIPPQWMAAYYMRRSLGDLLEQYQVAAVFTGHVHTYERSCPLIGGSLQCQKNPGEEDPSTIRGTGTVHICVGTGGAHLHRIPRWPIMNAWVQTYADEYGYGRIDVHNATHLEWKFVANEDGRIVDHTTIVNPYSL